MNSLLREHEITPQKLLEIFQGESLECGLDPEGDVQVESDAGLTCVVIVEPDAKMLRYGALCTLRENASPSEKLALAHLANQEVALARFTIPDPDTLAADHFLLYEGGVTAFQIVNNLRWFSRVVVEAIRSLDENDLVL